MSTSKSPVLLLLILAVAFTHPRAEAQGAKKIDGDSLLANDRVSKIEFTLADEDWAKLKSESPNFGVFTGVGEKKDYTYFKADVVIDGVAIDSVAVRKKGFFGSNDGQRPSLKVKFDEYKKQSPVKGLSRLTLNNNKQDTSLVSQYLCYKLFRDAGVKASRCGFASVTVNGEHLGVYSQIESVRKPFLAHAFGDKTGKLYEGTIADFYPKAIGSIEAKSDAADVDRSRILKLAELILPDRKLELDELKKVIDVDYFMKFWAMEGLLRFWDGYGGNQNNYFLYINPKTELGYFVPWGADSCFSLNGGPFARFGASGPTSIYAKSLLAHKLYKSADMSAQYRTTMQKLLANVWKEDELLAEIDRLETLLTPHLGDSQANAADKMDDIRDFIRGRRDVVEAELADWPPQIDDEPRKPAYTVPVGTVAATFAGQWSDSAASDSTKVGEAELTVELDGKKLTFSGSGSGAWLKQVRRFGPGRGAQPAKPVVVLAGTRENNGNVVTITLNVARKTLEGTPNPAGFAVSGTLTDAPANNGGRGFGGGFGGFGSPGQTVKGTLVLTKAGTKVGDAIEGKLELQILETHGGFMNQRRRGGRSFGRGTTPNSGRSRRPN